MLSCDFLKSFFAASNCLIVAIDRQQQIVYSNLSDLDCPVLPHTVAEYSRCFKLLSPTQNDYCDPCLVRKVFTSGEPLVRKTHHPHLGKLEISCLPIHDAQGAIALVIKQVRPLDISLAREPQPITSPIPATENNAETPWQKDLARHYFDVAEVIMVVLDREGRICQLNRKGCQLLGYQEEELIGRDWFDTCLPPQERQSIRHRFTDMAQGNRDAEKKAEYWLRTRDGQKLLMAWSRVRLTDHLGRVTHFICSGEDITDHRRAHKALQESESRYQYLAHHDTLTNLPNRLLFLDRMELALTRARRFNRQLALFFLDLDRLKNVNDSLGHGIGDQVLVAFAAKLQRLMRESDTLARLSGDEFVVLCEEIGSLDNAQALAELVLAAFAQPLQVNGHTIFTPVSIGIALLDSEVENGHDLLRAADIAMYQAKKSGGNRYMVYDSSSNSRRREVFHLESHLRRAVELGETFLHYQPQIDLRSGRLIGVEALARWKHPRMGLVAPNKFIAIAEETGQIVTLGDWVLETACAQNKAWQDAGLPPITTAVNISPHQLSQADFPERIQRILDKTKLDPRYLEIEITETAIMDNVDQARKAMRGLCQQGISFALDDFGTGYSSLSNLRYLPLKRLKIDRSFIHDVPHSDQDVRLVSSVLALARSLDLQVVAEGIESEQQLTFLQQKGSEIGQGYYFSQPVTAEELQKLMARNFL